MNLEDHILCLCTRQTFGADPGDQLHDLCADGAIDWARLFETAEAHRVSPLVGHNLDQVGLNQIGMPSALRSKFKTAYIHNALKKQGTDRALEQVLGLLASSKVRVMVVKGAAYDHLYYQESWYTISGDVDLVFDVWPDTPAGDDEKSVLESIDAINVSRGSFQAFIEFDLFMHHDISMNEVLSVTGEMLWAAAEPIELLGYPVWVLPAEEQLLTAAINSCRKRYFYLKSLLDMAVILETNPGLDWPSVLRIARRWQANTILYTALAVMKRTIGGDLPEDIMDNLKVNPLRRRVIDALIVRLLGKPLLELARGSPYTIFGRSASRTLLLTYASYPLSVLLRKIREVWRAWRQPPPAIPPPVPAANPKEPRSAAQG
jgi:hypothetical protein